MMLKQFEKELSAYRKNNTLPQGQVKNKLADIYEELWPQHKNWGASKVNRTCPSCISDMMKSLCAHWESMKVEFKGVPQAKELTEAAINLAEAVLESVEAMETLKENAKTAPDKNDIHSMKWPQFKTYCKEQGLSVKGKTKKQLLKELGL